MLTTPSRCIGCRACVTKCKEANALPYSRSADGLYDAPNDLNSETKNIIKVVNTGDKWSFMKAQCMHCVDPSCVSACMMGAAPGGRGHQPPRGREEGHGHRAVRQVDLCRLPLLPDRLPVQRPEVRVERGLSAHREV